MSTPSLNTVLESENAILTGKLRRARRDNIALLEFVEMLADGEITDLDGIIHDARNLTKKVNR